MTSAAEKLLERMRSSRSGWRVQDLQKLYVGFGFSIRHGKSYDIVVHPLYPTLRATLPRHNYLAAGYVEFALKLIDRLHEMEQRGAQ